MCERKQIASSDELNYKGAMVSAVQYIVNDVTGLMNHLRDYPRTRVVKVVLCRV